MENVKFETRRQIIINFYQIYEAKGKPYTAAHFAKMNVPRRTVYNTIAWYESGDTYKQGEGAGQPKKLTGVQERKVLKKMENKNEGPYATFYWATHHSFLSVYPLWINSTSHFMNCSRSIQVSLLIYTC